jgi:hypothetical protein
VIRFEQQRQTDGLTVVKVDGDFVLWGSDPGGRMNVYLARTAWKRCVTSGR